MTTDLTTIGAHKVKSVSSGQATELKSLWQDQNVAIVFFRRWGCMLCRLWAKELGEIAPVLQNNNVKLIGIGVEEAGSKEFVDGKFFDGDLYYVEDMATYNTLGFKRFNVVTIITSLFWKQSREAIFKGREMGLGGDLKGDWVQTGGALLVGNGGKLLRHFVQTGPADHLTNLEILKHFGLENEYKPESMANKSRDNAQCTLSFLVMTGALSRIISASPYIEVEGVKFDYCAHKSSLDNDDSLLAEQAHGPQKENSYVKIEDIAFKNLVKKEDAEDTKNKTLPEEDNASDIVDREDHITQHLSDMMINTDSEITSLQANEYDSSKEENNAPDEVGYFAFLTGQEKTFEIDGAWSKPAINTFDEEDTNVK